MIKQVVTSVLAVASAAGFGVVATPAAAATATQTSITWGTPVSLSGALLRAVMYQLLLHNETLVPLTQFWHAAAALAAGTPLSDVDTAVLGRCSPTCQAHQECRRTTRSP